MFTGIIETMAKVVALLKHNGDARVSIELKKLPKQKIKLGDSIAINGSCLTVVKINNKTIVFDASAETLRCTTLGDLTPKQWVNIEFAMLPTTRFGGHIVSGHVDGIAKIVNIKPVGESLDIRFKVPNELQKYIATKGSICVDGISLTVNHVKKNEFSVNIIPHTWQNTAIQFYQVGTRVNIEIDLVARYLERMLSEQKV